MMTQAALSALREEMKNTIAYAEYDDGGVTRQAEIAEKVILPDGTISIGVMILSAQGSVNGITQVRFYDAADTLLISEDTQISEDAGVEGIYFRCLIEIEAGDVQA